MNIQNLRRKLIIIVWVGPRIHVVRLWDILSEKLTEHNVLYILNNFQKYFPVGISNNFFPI